MNDIIIRNARVINRGVSVQADVHIKGDRIEKIAPVIHHKGAFHEVNAAGLWLMPGIIDDQVHFREPGLTHKADIASESRAAVVGGITSFMEMPNTRPGTLTQELLQEKYDLAAQKSYCNYSFFMGVSNDNLDEVLRTNPKDVCGVKIFMGSSTGNMLVDNPGVLERLFSECPMLIATHCEDEQTIKNRTEQFIADYGDQLTAAHHPLIRNVDACFLSSSFAVELAKKNNTRLHILHISTRDELSLFDNSIPLEEKRITSEVCVHHLYFTSDDYEMLGNFIKCNPAIKEKAHRQELWQALLDDRLDIIATDHAPHTLEEKSQPYLQAPSGLPLVQHSLNIMLEAVQKGQITAEKMVEKMCHAPACCFKVRERGFVDEGNFADIVLVDPGTEWTVNKDNILYKCGWSPLSGKTFRGKVVSTYVNGTEVYNNKGFFKQSMGHRMLFDRI
jgi:dihydroorotase